MYRNFFDRAMSFVKMFKFIVIQFKYEMLRLSKVIESTKSEN